MKNLIAFVAFLMLSIGGLKAQTAADFTLISAEIVNIGNDVMIEYVYHIRDIDDNFVTQLRAPGTYFEQEAESIEEDKNTDLLTLVMPQNIKRKDIEENLQRTYDFAQ